MKRSDGSRKIGLALGGGAALGAAHVGVIRALEEFEISVSCIAGTSIGAFISAFVAFGMNWVEIRNIAQELNWLDVSGISLSQFGLLSNRKLGQLIKENIGEVDFSQARIPMAMVATDIISGEKVVLKEGRVAPAVMASTCIPGIFVPVEIEDRLLVDGGIMENVPITPLQNMGADIIIGVDLNAGYPCTKPKNIIEVLLRSFDLTLKAATRMQTEKADILIEPDLSSFNMVDTGSKDELIERGYLEAVKVLERII